MKISEIVAHLESFAPPALQESYDNAGLITGDRSSEITSALITIDVTEEVIDEAVRKKAGMIISHHPILFSPLKKITGNSYVERCIIKAIRENIALYAMHTNLDALLKGVNSRICEKLELQDIRILVPAEDQLRKLVFFVPLDHARPVREKIFEAGAGHIGNYDQCSFNAKGEGTFRGSEETNPFVGEKGIMHTEEELRVETIFPKHLEKSIIHALLKAHPYEEVAYDIYPLTNEYKEAGSGMIGILKNPMDEKSFLKLLKDTFKTGSIRHTPLLGKKIKTVAVCGGSGSFLLRNAMSQDADVFVSGDFKYHQFFDADGRILAADIGHYESEQFTTEIIYDLCIKKFPTFAFHFSKVSTNPVNYF
ncbi:MAG: Nif3-like dinuclear metal center hexameric protein [Bacteroidales bacterium]|nr:Nif3-like dinuclear metal center hexameric protein [Bacteroidales bacterium]